MLSRKSVCGMKLVIKKYKDLSRDELYEILRLRNAVFIVEQACPYQDIDETDKTAYHVFLQNEDGIQAYLRVFREDPASKEARIGRVIAVKRRCGMGSRILAEGIKLAKEELHASAIGLEAQVYARTLYEKQGFVQTSEEFLEDGIPHIEMKLQLEDRGFE